jgi:hypothetical protein
MKVRLSLLDKIGSLSYYNPVPVSTYDGCYRDIGICRIYRDEQGNHYGMLDINEHISPESFFYYRQRANNDGVFLFSGLDLMPTQMKENPTTQLKQMIMD